jgi:hypothetical protein
MELLSTLHGYDSDFCTWAEEQAQLLRERRFDLIDVENIAEEIESLSRHDHRELRSRLEVLLTHLLKWQYQPQRRGSSWCDTIVNQRREIELVLEDSPSLLKKVQDEDWLRRVWIRAKAQARRETSVIGFPVDCPWDIVEQVLDVHWFP